MKLVKATQERKLLHRLALAARPEAVGSCVLHAGEAGLQVSKGERITEGKVGRAANVSSRDGVQPRDHHGVFGLAVVVLLPLALHGALLHAPPHRHGGRVAEGGVAVVKEVLLPHHAANLQPESGAAGHHWVNGGDAKEEPVLPGLIKGPEAGTVDLEVRRHARAEGRDAGLGLLHRPGVHGGIAAVKRRGELQRPTTAALQVAGALHGRTLRQRRGRQRGLWGGDVAVHRPQLEALEEGAGLARQLRRARARGEHRRARHLLAGAQQVPEQLRLLPLCLQEALALVDGPAGVAETSESLRGPWLPRRGLAPDAKTQDVVALSAVLLVILFDGSHLRLAAQAKPVLLPAALTVLVAVGILDGAHCLQADDAAQAIPAPGTVVVTPDVADVAQALIAGDARGEFPARLAEAMALPLVLDGAWLLVASHADHGQPARLAEGPVFVALRAQLFPAVGTGDLRPTCLAVTVPIGAERVA
mmetsp:Transcript_25126/g.78918  ORF Transcript_25126/g.78918 Transcript_25126/m.78918 type:complete len:475 (+) Transcript_25126:1251-2675(+)